MNMLKLSNLGLVLIAVSLLPPNAPAKGWPVVRHFDKDHLYRVALPMGGIGTGSVSLSGRGELCDWEIMNVPNKGSLSGECDGIGRSFFSIRAKGKDLNVTRMLDAMGRDPIEEKCS